MYTIQSAKMVSSLTCYPYAHSSKYQYNDVSAELPHGLSTMEMVVGRFLRRCTTSTSKSELIFLTPEDYFTSLRYPWVPPNNLKINEDTSLQKLEDNCLKITFPNFFNCSMIDHKLSSISVSLHLSNKSNQ